MSLFNPTTWFRNNKPAPKKSIKLPTDPITGQSAPYNNDYLQFAQNSVNAGSFVPYSNETIAKYGYGDYLNGGGGGSGTGGGGGGGIDPQLLNLRNDATNRIKSILSAYDGLFGGIDNTVRDKTNQLNESYDQQTTNLNKSFENTQGATGSAYAGRGLGQSSFLGDALGQNADVYNQNTQALVNDRNNSLADLGRYAATSKAQFGAGKDQYNSMLGQLGNYDASSLSALIPSLQQAYGNIQGQAAGLGTNQQFISGLNAISPVQNRGVDQLKSKLDNLINSGAPNFAKNQLANGVIKQAGIADPSQQNYWSNYWAQLQGN